VSVLLVQGDARRIPLKDASVHVCCTSPPYWNLRDYGTGQWVGGEAGCDHSTPRSRGDDIRPGDKQGTSAGSRPNTLPSCPRCGAVRVDQQIGMEKVHDCLAWARQEPPCAACWVCSMRAVFAEVHRVMRPEAPLWLNCGDAYAGSPVSGFRGGHNPSIGNHGISNRNGIGAVAGLKPKNLLGLPWRLALALQQDGFILRSEIIWHKLNPMPESVQDRPTRAHEQVFLFSKQAKYWYDGEAVKDPLSAISLSQIDTFNRRGIETEVLGGLDASRNDTGGLLDRKGSGSRGAAMAGLTGRACRTVWSLASEPFSGSHFATFPTELVRRCLLAGAPREVCCACGKPWVRQVERADSGHVYPRGTCPADHRGIGQPQRTGSGSGALSVTTITTGFSPSCTCVAPTRPSTILDPFCGSGTTLLVARELGHHGIGLDLSLDYLTHIARERLGLAALHRWTHGAVAQPTTYTDLPLFAAGD
jgi:DNA modification methylase